MHASWTDLARRVSLAVALASGCGAPAMAANAGTDELVVLGKSADTYSVLVSGAGLNLHSAAGAAALHQRVRIAAVRLCGAVMPNEPFWSDASTDCAGDAVHDAGPQMRAMIAAAGSSNRVATAATIVMAMNVSAR